MNELNEVWEKMMQEAMLNAQVSGRTDIVEYLALKSANDELRATGCRWLFDSFIELSAEANRQGIKLDVENENPHRFSIGHSTMVGSLLRFKNGLRNLTIEAGWTRTPQDGFIRGGGLACARISHFGMGKFNAELLLVNHRQTAPNWFILLDEDGRKPLSSNSLREHFNLFLDTT
jgi:hypothetical protein